MCETLHLVHLLPNPSCSSEEKLNIIRDRDRIFLSFQFNIVLDRGNCR